MRDHFQSGGVHGLDALNCVVIGARQKRGAKCACLHRGRGGRVMNWKMIKPLAFAKLNARHGLIKMQQARGIVAIPIEYSEGGVAWSLNFRHGDSLAKRVAQAAG